MTDPTTHQGSFLRAREPARGPQPAIEIWIGGYSEAAYRRAALFGSGFQVIGLKPLTVAEPIARLRRDHPDPESFTISRTGWDPQGMDPAEIGGRNQLPSSEPGFNTS